MDDDDIIFVLFVFCFFVFCLVVSMSVQNDLNTKQSLKIQPNHHQDNGNFSIERIIIT